MRFWMDGAALALPWVFVGWPSSLAAGGCLLQAGSCLLWGPPLGPGEAVLILPAQQGGLGLPQLSLSCLAPLYPAARPKFWGRTG